MAVTPSWIRRLHAVGACEEATKWAIDYPTFVAAWQACERPDWLLWFVGKVTTDDLKARKQLVLCACACARTALVHVPKGEARPLRAIEMAEQWARGENDVTLPQVRDAADAAAYAAYAAYAYAAYAANAAKKQMATIVREYYPAPPTVTVRKRAA